VSIFAVKALLAPTFVVGASLVARRFGPWLGGVIGGLPVVAGPILLVYALEHGGTFAQHAAGGTLLGLISLSAFAVVYGRLAPRASWFVCMLAGWVAFGLATLAFDGVVVPSGVALALDCAAFVLGLALLPRPAGEEGPRPSPPRWDLPVRAGCAFALVLVLTTASGRLGAQLSGLLAPFPVITTVLASFTHAQRGAADAVRLLRGMLTGFGAFALFCFTLTLSLPGSGVAAAFVLATVAALIAQAAMISRGRHAAGADRLASLQGAASISVETVALGARPAPSSEESHS
jgi:hypothetical protein